MRKLIALAGVARSGKDCAAEALIKKGFIRHNFGDVIKAQLDDLVMEHLGFSAFTEDDTLKARIRGLLEQWGEANYDKILWDYLKVIDNQDAKCYHERLLGGKKVNPSYVNTRLVRLREAKEWTERGGEIWLVDRINTFPATEWEKDRLNELIDSGYITKTIFNWGTVEQLHKNVLEALQQ